MYWTHYVDDLAGCLHRLEVSDRLGAQLGEGQDVRLSVVEATRPRG